MSIECAACERNLSAYIDDELPADLRLDIEQHLDDCESCRASFGQHQAAWEAAQRVQAGPAPERTWETVQAGLEAGSASTGLEDLALMVRGLAEEVRNLRREVNSLRRDLAAAELAEEQPGEEDIRVQMRRFAAGRPRQASIEQLRRTS